MNKTIRTTYDNEYRFSVYYTDGHVTHASLISPESDAPYISRTRLELWRPSEESDHSNGTSVNVTHDGENMADPYIMGIVDMLANTYALNDFTLFGKDFTFMIDGVDVDKITEFVETIAPTF